MFKTVLISTRFIVFMMIANIALIGRGIGDMWQGSWLGLFTFTVSGFSLTLNWWLFKVRMAIRRQQRLNDRDGG